MSKKQILIPGYKSESGFFGAGSNHLEYLSQFGNVRILMPYEEIVKGDLLYLPGGLDLNPGSYGEIPGFKTSNQDVFKQYFYDNRLKGYVESGIPIFGVCLGFQMLATFFGSKLTQNLTHHASTKARSVEGHKIIILTEDGRISRNNKGEVDKRSLLPVNSHHHQGITVSGLSKDLKPLWIADDEEIIEAFKHKTLNIAAVQHHPEEWFDDHTAEIIYQLLESKDTVLS